MVKIMIASDFHGDIDSAKKVADKAKEEKVDLVLLAGDILGFQESTGDILQPFVELKEKTFFIPGNWDFKEEIVLCERFAKNLHHCSIVHGDIGIVGLGSPDWKLSLNYDDVIKTRYNLKNLKTKKKILLSHLHVKDSLAEFSGVPGDYFLKKIIEETEPDILISGHVHEAEGLESKIGKTKIFHVGRKGKIIEL